jgi:hypothetical protein
VNLCALFGCTNFAKCVQFVIISVTRRGQEVHIIRPG